MFSAPLAGLTSAENLLDNTATRVASPSATETDPVTGPVEMPADKVELTDEMTSLIQALTTFEANSKALEVEASLAESTLSITA